MKITITYLDGPREGDKLEFSQERIRIGTSVDNEVNIGGIESLEIEHPHRDYIRVRLLRSLRQQRR